MTATEFMRMSSEQQRQHLIASQKELLRGRQLRLAAAPTKSVPEPPSLADAIRAARATESPVSPLANWTPKPVTSKPAPAFSVAAARVLLKSAVPPPPSLADAIRALKEKVTC